MESKYTSSHHPTYLPTYLHSYSLPPSPALPTYRVKRGYNHQTKKHVALKIIDKVNTPRRVLQMLGTEIAAMKALDQHPHILSLLHYDMTAVYPRKSGGTR